MFTNTATRRGNVTGKEENAQLIQLLRADYYPNAEEIVLLRDSLAEYREVGKKPQPSVESLELGEVEVGADNSAGDLR